MIKTLKQMNAEEKKVYYQSFDKWIKLGLRKWEAIKFARREIFFKENGI